MNPEAGASIEIDLSAASEREELDYKSAFDGQAQGWCELVKDIVAMANTNGGRIVLGVQDNGSVAPGGYTGAIDPADVSNKVRKYTGVNLPGIQVQAIENSGERILAIVVPPNEVPIPFSSPGTYEVEGRRQKTAFGQGTVYFRHGSKSEPGTMEDFARFVSKVTERVRGAWIDRLRLVTEAPIDAVLGVLPVAGYEAGSEGSVGVRLVHDPSAPKIPAWSPDETHPYRQTELVREVKKKLPKGTRFNSHDVQCLRKLHQLDGDPNFYHKPIHGSPQYSPALRDWIVEKHASDSEFFNRARKDYLERKKSG